MMSRREVLHLAVVGGTAASVLSNSADAVEESSHQFAVVDTNVSLFRWPFRDLPFGDPETFVQKLRSLSISQAWAGSFEGLLHRDVSQVNQRLAETCATYSELIPFGSVNLSLPNWEDDLRRCSEDHGMPGIRLHPNYHGYTLDDPRFVQLLERAADLQLLVQIASAMEDTRTQHPLATVDDVDLALLTKIVPRIPEVSIQILNHRLRAPLLEQLARSGNVYFDTARVESTDGIPQLVQAVTVERVLFGSHAPFLIPEAALIRVHESDQLDRTVLNSIYAGNAPHVLPKVKA